MHVTDGCNIGVGTRGAGDAIAPRRKWIGLHPQLDWWEMCLEECRQSAPTRVCFLDDENLVCACWTSVFVRMVIVRSIYGPCASQPTVYALVRGVAPKFSCAYCQLIGPPLSNCFWRLCVSKPCQYLAWPVMSLSWSRYLSEYLTVQEKDAK